ncbi:hypothetical protein [Glutamicibacter sp. NPDC087583]|uniref:hypothetical protein n=1 Tax=Glutamicibacter sp. NPDC087583 TaxID=3363995 RepID=UPI003822CA5D
MADYSKVLEAQALARVDAAMAASGLLEGLKRDHTSRPLLAKQLQRSLRAFGYAVYRGSLYANDASRVVTQSEEQAYRAQITSLEELLHAMATPLHARDPKLRAGIPFIPEAALPPGDGFFTAFTSYFPQLHGYIKRLRPCFCAAQTSGKPRAHQHAA